MHAGRGRDLITDKRPPCYAAIRVPVRRMGFNSRRRIEFVRSVTGDCKNEKKKTSVTGLEWNEQSEMSDSSASEIKWKEGSGTHSDEEHIVELLFEDE